MKSLTKIFALILAVSTLFLLASCGAGNGDDTTKGDDSTVPSFDSITLPTTDAPETDPAPAVTFTLTVKDDQGNCVSGIKAMICKPDQSCFPSMDATDENGVTYFYDNQFTEVTEGYTFSLLYCPEGYEYEYVGDTKLYLDPGATELEIILKKVG
ncbi:MAG: hypothetical protein IKL24_06625 [Clostridia bacterium]|nr:hypothetical protein [Clostridia bacterium]